MRLGRVFACLRAITHSRLKTGPTVLLAALVAGIATAQTPDRHTPHPASTPPRSVSWSFDNVQGLHPPTFAAIKGSGKPTPMYGKMELATDANFPADPGYHYLDDGTGNGVLDLAGDTVVFHADAPFLGKTSLRFREPDYSPEHPEANSWGIEAGGIRIGNIWPSERSLPARNYQMLLGKYMKCAVSVTRSSDWHSLSYQLKWNNDPKTWTGAHRYIEVFLDGKLILRHGFPARLHSLKVSQGTHEPRQRLWIDDVRFEDDPTGTNGAVCVLHAPAPPTGVSTHDFEVLSPTNTSRLELDIPPPLGDWIASHPSDPYCLFLWATPLNLPTVGAAAAPIRLLSEILPGPHVDTPRKLPGGWWRIRLNVERHLDRGGYWFTCAVLPSPDPSRVTPSEVRTMSLPTRSDGKPVGFDERLVLLQGEQPGEPVRQWVLKWVVEEAARPTGHTGIPLDEVHRRLLSSLTTDDLLPRGGTCRHQLPTANGGGGYIEAPSGPGTTLANFSFRFDVPPSDYGKLHKVVIEYPVDKPRDMTFSVTELVGGRPSMREPVSANVFLPGPLITSDELGGLPVVPTWSPGQPGAPTATRTLYIYPGGPLLVVAMNRTSGMPSAVRSVRVYVESDTQPAPEPSPFDATGAMLPAGCGTYVEAPSVLPNLFGTFKNWDTNVRGDLQPFLDWTDAPSCWNLPKYHASTQRLIRYQKWVNRQFFGGLPFLNQISFDVIYYRTAYFPTGAFERWNWEVYPAQEVEVPPETGHEYHGRGIPGNKWPWGQFYYSTRQTPIADFDLAGWTAALCQGEGMRFLPVIDFRGSAELDTKNDTGFYLNGEPRHGLSGWSPSDVNDNPGKDVTRFLVARDGHLACGGGDTGVPGPNHGNSGYNALHPDVRAALLETMSDLRRSVGPFMAGSSYGPAASVFDVGLTINERSHASLLVHPREGNKYAGQYPITDECWWKQSDWSYDDVAWKAFQEDRPGTPFDPAAPGGNRFARRFSYLQANRLEQAYRETRYECLARLYKDMLDRLRDGGSKVKLALLYQAPTWPGFNITPGQDQTTWSTPQGIADYLDAGIALPKTLDRHLGPQPKGDRRDRRGDVVYVPQVLSMYNTRYQPPVDSGDALTGWKGDQLPTGKDNMWVRSRWFDYDKQWRDRTLDIFAPWTWSPASPFPSGQVGGWVFYQFIESFTQSNAKPGWGPIPPDDAKHTYDYPGIGTNGEPADIAVRWTRGLAPIFSQHPSSLEMPAWSVPYSSLYTYFKSRLGAHSAPEILLFGGWDTTGIYGHERELADSFRERGRQGSAMR